MSSQLSRLLVRVARSAPCNTLLLTSYCGLKGMACQVMTPCCIAAVTRSTSVVLGQVQPILGGQSRNRLSSQEWLRYLCGQAAHHACMLAWPSWRGGQQLQPLPLVLRSGLNAHLKESPCVLLGEAAKSCSSLACKGVGVAVHAWHASVAVARTVSCPSCTCMCRDALNVLLNEHCGRWLAQSQADQQVIRSRIPSSPSSQRAGDGDESRHR